MNSHFYLYSPLRGRTRELREKTESEREILIDDIVKEKHIKKNKLMQTDTREEKKDDKRTDTRLFLK